MSRGRMDTMSLADVNALGEDDRKAVMEMVRDGEMDLGEAIAKVKELASKQVRARAGGMKRKRGRLEIEISVLKSHFSVVDLRVKKARDLMQIGKSNVLNPYVKAWISPATDAVKPTKPQTTKVRKGSTNPMFDEDFKWTVETGEATKGGMRLHISVETTSAGFFGKVGKKVIGCMSFGLTDLLKDKQGVVVTGWYRLLAEDKGQRANMPYHHHKPLVPPVEAPKQPAPTARRGSADEIHQLAEPPKPGGGQLAPPRLEQRRHSAPNEAEEAARVSPQAAKAVVAGDAAVQPQAAPRPPPLGEMRHSGAYGFDSGPSTSPPAAAPAAAPVLSDRVHSGAYGFDDAGSGGDQSGGGGATAVRKSKAARPAKPAFKVTADSFNFLKVLGQGSFGRVLLAEHKVTREVYAVKVIKKLAVIEDDDVEATMTERRVLALSSGCPFLTGLHATFQADDKLFYVMELIGGGDLMFHIQNDKVFAVPRARFYGAEICIGLWYLHDHGVIYRDLKLDNVMLDEWGHVKIADFGMCKEGIKAGDRTTTFCGTPGYLAPEIINEKPYDGSVDWWSLGVLMYEMLIGDSPFDAEDDDELFRQILTLKLEYPKSLDASAKDICMRFLNRDPSKRLGADSKGAEGIKSHPFFASIDWDKLAKREIPPPWAPRRSEDKTAAINFDDDFTSEDPTVSPPQAKNTRQIDQQLFKGFSFATTQFVKGATGGDGDFDEEDEDAFEGDANDAFDEAAATAPPRLEDQPWYKPGLSRQQIVDELKGKPAGTWLLRPSKTQPGCYVMSVTVQAEVPWSGLVVPAAGGGYRVTRDRTFDNLLELVDHYTLNPITQTPSGARVTLRAF